MNAEHAWRYFQAFLEENGWRIVGFAIVFYIVKQKYTEYATSAHVRRTLAEANDPQRVALLQREATRVREEQQRRLQETQPRKSKPKHELKKDT